MGAARPSLIGQRRACVQRQRHQKREQLSPHRLEDTLGSQTQNKLTKRHCTRHEVRPTTMPKTHPRVTTTQRKHIASSPPILTEKMATTRWLDQTCKKRPSKTERRENPTQSSNARPLEEKRRTETRSASRTFRSRRLDAQKTQTLEQRESQDCYLSAADVSILGAGNSAFHKLIDHAVERSWNSGSNLRHFFTLTRR